LIDFCSRFARDQSREIKDSISLAGLLCWIFRSGNALATLDVRPLDRLHPHALVARKQALTDLGFSSLHRKVVKKAMASMSAHAGESALEARGALWG
jgi:hypothetical protein